MSRILQAMDRAASQVAPVTVGDSVFTADEVRQAVADIRARIQALNAALAGLEDLGFGTDEPINGGDAVEAISALYLDITTRILRSDHAQT